MLSIPIFVKNKKCSSIHTNIKIFVNFLEFERHYFWRLKKWLLHRIKFVLCIVAGKTWKNTQTRVVSLFLPSQSTAISTATWPCRWTTCRVACKHLKPKSMFKLNFTLFLLTERSKVLFNKIVMRFQCSIWGIRGQTVVRRLS